MIISHVSLSFTITIGDFPQTFFRPPCPPPLILLLNEASNAIWPEPDGLKNLTYPKLQQKYFFYFKMFVSGQYIGGNCVTIEKKANLPYKYYVFIGKSVIC